MAELSREEKVKLAKQKQAQKLQELKNMDIRTNNALKQLEELKKFKHLNKYNSEKIQFVTVQKAQEVIKLGKYDDILIFRDYEPILLTQSQKIAAHIIADVISKVDEGAKKFESKFLTDSVFFDYLLQIAEDVSIGQDAGKILYADEVHLKRALEEEKQKQLNPAQPAQNVQQPSQTNFIPKSQEELYSNYRALVASLTRDEVFYRNYLEYKITLKNTHFIYKYDFSKKDEKKYLKSWFVIFCLEDTFNCSFSDEDIVYILKRLGKVFGKSDKKIKELFGIIYDKYYLQKNLTEAKTTTKKTKKDKKVVCGYHK